MVARTSFSVRLDYIVFFMFFEPCICTVQKVKKKGGGKVNPRTGHEGPEGEQMYSCTLPSTLALDGGG